MTHRNHELLEDVEETQNQGEEPAEIGSAGRFGISSRQHQTGLLVCDAHSGGQHVNDKRKTDTRGLL